MDEGHCTSRQPFKLEAVLEIVPSDTSGATLTLLSVRHVLSAATLPPRHHQDRVHGRSR